MQKRLQITLLDVLALLITAMSAGYLCYYSPSSYQPEEDGLILLGTAQSLVQSGSYYFNYIPQTKFPPGVPFLLAIIESYSANNPVQLYMILSLFAALGAGVSYLTIRAIFGRLEALVALIMLVSAPGFFWLTTNCIASDNLYLLLSSLALLLLSRNTAQRMRIVNLLIFSIVLLCVVMTRIVGIALIAAVLVQGLVWLLGRTTEQRKSGWLLLCASIPAVAAFFAWILWSKTNRDSYSFRYHMDSYFDQLKLLDPRHPDLGVATVWDYFLRFFHTFPIRAASFSEIAVKIPWINPLWLSPFVIVPCVLIAIGIVQRLRSKQIVCECYFLCYLFIYLLWLFDENERFILPVFPLGIAYAFVGVKYLLERFVLDRQQIIRQIFVISALLSIIAIVNHGLTSTTNLQRLAATLFWIVLTVVVYASSKTKLIEAFIVAQGRRVLLLTLIFTAVAGLLQIQRDAAAKQEQSETAHYHYPALEAANWIQKNTAPNEIAMAEQFAMVHFFSKRKCIPTPVTAEGSVLVEAIRTYNVGYIVVEKEREYPYLLPPEQRRIEALLRIAPELIALVHKSDFISIYKVIAH